MESNPPIQQSGNSIRIGYNLPDDVKRHVSIDYEITVPADTALQAHSGSGNVMVEGVRSEVQAQTGSGDIKMRDLGSKLKGSDWKRKHSCRERSGALLCPDRKRRYNGDLDRLRRRGSSCRLRQHHHPRYQRRHKCPTGSGDIQGDGTVTGPWQLHSGSGNVRLAVGSGNGFNLDVHTSSGSIHSDLPITVQGTVGGHELKGAVHGGGPTVEVSTSSGDVEIR